MLDFLNSKKNSSLFFKFSKVADIDIGGFNNLEKNNLKFQNSKITIRRNTNLISDVLYFFRENKYKTSDNYIFSFFGPSTKIYVPDGKDSDSVGEMKLDIIELISFKKGFFTYELKQKICTGNYNTIYTYKVKSIKLIISEEIGYLIYPNGMGRIYKK